MLVCKTVSCNDLCNRETDLSEAMEAAALEIKKNACFFKSMADLAMAFGSSRSLTEVMAMSVAALDGLAARRAM